ncbi:hypothetical protein CcaCcLH18_12789 [Colletotrichum camelliae]|nr:hypothetical protein CcaCcLH18_12789 [Colletotrichum camelliae]
MVMSLSDVANPPTGASAMPPARTDAAPQYSRNYATPSTAFWLPPEPLHPPTKPSGPPGYPLAWIPSAWIPSMCKHSEPLHQEPGVSFADVRAYPMKSDSLSVPEVNRRIPIATHRGLESSPASGLSLNEPAPRVPNPNCYPPTSTMPCQPGNSSSADEIAAGLHSAKLHGARGAT